jgi:ABC-type oligopeptide transport system substrate-binding subunit
VRVTGIRSVVHAAHDLRLHHRCPDPAQADSVTLSSDGLVYTIKIKSGWTFHNGEPVDAKSYVDAWNYAADCTNGYILNTFFQRIEGYDALNPSDCKNVTTKEMSGLSVVDDTTFTVTLLAPFSQFPTTLGFDAYNPLPQAFYDDPDAYNEAPIGDGPYMMDGKWKHDDTINLQRYPDYAGTPATQTRSSFRPTRSAATPTGPTSRRGTSTSRRSDRRTSQRPNSPTRIRCSAARAARSSSSASRCTTRISRARNCGRPCRWRSIVRR